MKSNTFRAAFDGHGRSRSLLARAQRALDESDLDSARRYSLQLAKQQPDHLGALEVLARAQWKLERYEDALATLDRLVALNPYEPGYFYLRGLICQGVGRFGEAIDAMQRCLRFEDSPVANQAVDALRDLEAWQGALVAETLAMDAAFRAEFARSPIEACAARGYRFSDEERMRAIAWQDRVARSLVWLAGSQ